MESRSLINMWNNNSSTMNEWPFLYKLSIPSINPEFNLDTNTFCEILFYFLQRTLLFGLFFSIGVPQRSNAAPILFILFVNDFFVQNKIYVLCIYTFFFYN